MTKLNSYLVSSLLMAAYASAAPTKEADVIPGKYIVTLNSDVSAEQLQILVDGFSSQFQAQNTKFNLGHVYNIDDGFKGFSGEFDTSALKLLQADASVKRVEPDRIAHMSATQKNSPNWGLGRLSSSTTDFDSTSYKYPDQAGQGVTVYVLDTGCDARHPEFEGRATLGKAFGSPNSNDGQGHGTHVTGTIIGKTVGVAKKAQAVCVKVLTDDGSGSFSDIIAGIQWAVSQSKGKKSLINMSLGGPSTEALDEAVEAAISKGVLVVAAAGNDSLDACDYSPARASSAITVAASTMDNAHAYFSNGGTCVDVYAPGHEIYSSFMGGSYKTMSGTSMASPHVAGVAAVYLSQKSLNAKSLHDFIVKNGAQEIIYDPAFETANVLAQVFFKA